MQHDENKPMAFSGAVDVENCLNTHEMFPTLIFLFSSSLANLCKNQKIRKNEND